MYSYLICIYLIGSVDATCNMQLTARLNGEAECATWSRHQPYECFASTDNGAVCCYDVRKVAAKEKSVLWTLLFKMAQKM